MGDTDHRPDTPADRDFARRMLHAVSLRVGFFRNLGLHQLADDLDRALVRARLVSPWLNEPIEDPRGNER